MRELGVPVQRLLARWRQLRASHPEGISNGALYLSELLQEQIAQGTADAWGAELDRFGQLRFRRALAQARQLAAAQG